MDNFNKDQKKPPLQSQKQVRKGFNWNQIIWIVLIWIVISYLFGSLGSSNEEQISYTSFKNNLTKGNVKEITVKGNNITGQFKKAIKGKTEKGFFGKEKTIEYSTFKTVVPSFGGQNLMSLLENKDVTVNVKAEGRSMFWTLVIGVLPWVLIIGFFVYSSRKFQQGMGGGGGIFGFGKSKAKLYTKSMSNITLKDVAGLANAKKEFEEIIDYLKNPDKFRNKRGLF